MICVYQDAGVKKDGGNKTVVPLIGFELMTYRLQGGCSTN